MIEQLSAAESVSEEQIKALEALMSEAYSEIDKANSKVGGLLPALSSTRLQELCEKEGVSKGGRGKKRTEPELGSEVEGKAHLPRFPPWLAAGCPARQHRRAAEEPPGRRQEEAADRQGKTLGPAGVETPPCPGCDR